MIRVKRGNVARKRRNEVLASAKGFKGAHSRLFRLANQQVMKARVHSYVGRKRRKRDFKKLWMCRLNGHLSYLKGTYHLDLLNNPPRVEPWYFISNFRVLPWTRWGFGELMYQLARNRVLLNPKMLVAIAFLETR
jgi:large subunit ribosomal protein L20